MQRLSAITFAAISSAGRRARRRGDGRSRDGRPHAWTAISAVFVVCTLLAAGCDREPAAAPQTNDPAKITVASISPAATDLIVGMGAGDHLVAVSNFDRTRAETAHLPTVGDYRTIDWEQLASLRPTVLIVQFRSDKMPAGLLDRAAGYGIQVVNVEINRLGQIYQTLDQLGEAIGEPIKALSAADELRSRLDAVRARVADRAPVRTLISRTDNPLEAVGGGNFLDELLTIAGGRNVLSGPGYDDNSYPTLDREQVLSLNPDAVLNLLPAASPQVVEQARQFWKTVPVAAQRAGKVHYLTEEYLLWPGLNVANIAERFAEVLHPDAKPMTAAQNTKPQRHEEDTKEEAEAASVTRVSNPCWVRSNVVDRKSSALPFFDMVTEDSDGLKFGRTPHGLETRVTDAFSGTSFVSSSRLRGFVFSSDRRDTRDHPEAA